MSSNEDGTEYSLFYPPWEWISYTVTSIICTIINYAILKKEYNKRKSSAITFQSQYFKIWSILTLFTGFIVSMVMSIQYFPYTCYVGFRLASFLPTTQFVFMGFYQLSRLYYCFSLTKIHSNKGYPNWMFIIMYIIGYIILIYGIIDLLHLSLYLYCS